MSRRTPWMILLLVASLMFSMTGCQKRIFAAYQSTSTASADNISSSAEVMDLERVGVSVIQAGDNIDFNLPTDVFFKFGTSEFNPHYRWVLAEIVTIMKDYDLMPIHINGYTDNVGAEKLKKRLALHRAERIETYMWEKGFDFHRIRAEGMGSQHKVASNRSVKGSAWNRRVVIHVRLNPVAGKV